MFDLESLSQISESSNPLLIQTNILSAGIEITLPKVENRSLDSRRRFEVFGQEIGHKVGDYSRAYLTLYNTGEVDMSVIGNNDWQDDLIAIGIRTLRDSQTASQLYLAPLTPESLEYEFIMCILDLGQNIDQIEVLLPARSWPVEAFKLDPDGLVPIVVESINKGHLRCKAHDYEINSNFRSWRKYLQRYEKKLPSQIAGAIEVNLNLLTENLNNK